MRRGQSRYRGRLPMRRRMLGEFVLGVFWGDDANDVDRIMNATIRENILFSHRYDEDFYKVVLDSGVYFSYHLR